MEGGVAMATYEMARDLQCLGWDIHVLTPESGLPPDSSLPDPCSVTRISFVSSHETRHRIDACLEHIHPSLVIFHSWPGLASGLYGRSLPGTEYPHDYQVSWLPH